MNAVIKVRLDMEEDNFGLLNSPQHGDSLAPVTALAVFDKYLLAGTGTLLRIYNLKTFELVLSRRIFDSQAIHGILVGSWSSPHKTTLLVWGGRLVRLIELPVRFGINELEDAIGSGLSRGFCEAPDWILDVTTGVHPTGTKLTDQGQTGRCALLVTAHNVLYSLGSASMQRIDNDVYAIRQLTKGPKSILYSAHITWVTESRVLIAAGTAFGEAVVSSVNLDHAEPSFVTHHVFNGHEGSIFGISISEKLDRSEDHHFERLLASCSDDRTIRLWGIHNLAEVAHHDVLPTESSPPLLEHTGFFNANLNACDEANSMPVAVAMGHLSRIWKIKFLPCGTIDCNREISHLVSAGEDATSQLWKVLKSARTLASSEDLLYKLEHIETTHGHDGKNIWSIAVWTQGLAQDILTGAVDGRIIIKHLKESPLQRSKCLEASYGVDMIRLPGGVIAKPDMCRGYAFVNDLDLLVTTNNGHVNLVSLSPPVSDGVRLSASSWRWLATFDELRRFSVVASLPSMNVAFLAASNGSLYAYDGLCSKITLITTTASKVSGVFAQAATLPKEERVVDILVTGLGWQEQTHLIVVFDGSGNAEVVHRCSVPTSSAKGQFIITSVYFLQQDEQHEDGTPQKDDRNPDDLSSARDCTIFIGSRDGRILVRRLHSDNGVAFQVQAATQNDAITGMAWVPSDDCADSNSTPKTNAGWLFTIARDGFLRAHKFGKGLSESQLVHELLLPFGPNLEGLEIDDNRHVLVHGFHSTSFFVYDVTADWTRFSVDCGGSHRAWSFRPSTSGTGQGVNTFAWTQAGILRVHSSGSVAESITSGGHGREIKTCAFRRQPVMLAPAPEEEATMLPLFATGAEDTNIRLFCLNDSEQDRFRCVGTIRKHVTGVQHLEWSEDGSRLFSCGGREEFYVWRIQDLPARLIGVVCESVFPIGELSPDLRIMGFETEQAKMKHDSDSGKGKTVTITMIFSDSSLKVPMFDSYSWR